MYSDLFTNVGFDCWQWPLMIDANYRSLEQTIRIPIHPSNVPVVDGSTDTVAVRQCGQKSRQMNIHVDNQEARQCEMFALDRRMMGDHILSYRQQQSAIHGFILERSINLSV